MLKLSKEVSILLRNDDTTTSLSFCRNAGDDTISITVHCTQKVDGANWETYSYESIDIDDFRSFVCTLTEEFG